MQQSPDMPMVRCMPLLDSCNVLRSMQIDCSSPNLDHARTHQPAAPLPLEESSKRQDQVRLSDLAG